MQLIVQSIACLQARASARHHFILEAALCGHANKSLHALSAAALRRLNPAFIPALTVCIGCIHRHTNISLRALAALPDACPKLQRLTVHPGRFGEPKCAHTAL